MCDSRAQIWEGFQSCGWSIEVLRAQLLPGLCLPQNLVLALFLKLLGLVTAWGQARHIMQGIP